MNCEKRSEGLCTLFHYFADFDYCRNAIRFDPDCEGFVSLEELRFVLANLPVKISHQELEEMMKAADPDGDGKLSLEEFRTLLGM